VFSTGARLNGLDEGMMAAMALIEHNYIDFFEINDRGLTRARVSLSKRSCRFVGALRETQSSADEFTGHTDGHYVSASTL
jgi:hypothetical protein